MENEDGGPPHLTVDDGDCRVGSLAPFCFVDACVQRAAQVPRRATSRSFDNSYGEGDGALMPVTFPPSSTCDHLDYDVPRSVYLTSSISALQKEIGPGKRPLLLSKHGPLLEPGVLLEGGERAVRRGELLVARCAMDG